MAFGTCVDPERLHLARRGESGWFRDGERIPQVDGATGIDLFLTPATNTFALGQLSLPIGGIGDIVAALISYEKRTVWVIESSIQRYERLTNDDFRFSSFDSDGNVEFTADLIVVDGIVMRYGDHWLPA